MNSARRAAHASTVRLYLVRHAIAAERGPDWPDDSLRPLTHKGRARFRQVVQGLARQGVDVDVILTSPFVRAEQTARLLAAGISPEPLVELTAALAPGQAPDAVIRALEPYAGSTGVALVGHEPDLGLLAARLIGATYPLEFKKGGVCRIDVPGLPPAAHGHLVWHATPKLLRSSRR
ncbi:MAG: phosphohistidine phosphatase SixA [Vicinamibacterales bacterium]